MKLKEYDFIMNYDYYDFMRAHLINKANKKTYGTLYKLSKKLTDEQKAELLKYNNVQLFFARNQYAPEIVHNAVFVADHRISA